MRAVVPAVLLVAAGLRAAPAAAEPTNDGYCEFVEGVADSESALLFAPQLFGELGRIEQSSFSTQPGQEPGTVRFIGGMRLSLSNLYQGVQTRGRARADCRRHTALEQIRGETLFRAFDARANVLDGALPEADKLMAQVTADLDARRTTAQEATAMRLRVEELRRLATETHQAMSILPRPAGGELGLKAFQAADDDIETYDAKLRRARGIDVSVRAGVDDFLDGAVNSDTSSPYFAAVSVSFNLGVLFQSGANTRAADGRRRFLRSGRDPLSVDATADRLRALVEVAERRVAETTALENDLAKQIEVLNRVGGDDSRKYRQIVWFDLIKVRAERAFHEAHATALKQVIGGK